ncbi:hypothetical protein [Erythrobacter sp. Alg231-14]|uniref:hypothetical protein n=1 Tax=Erythrobacter sp. Alg231-14 TaxID=1922225 RepID=UPI00307B3037
MTSNDCVAGRPIHGWYEQMAALRTLRHPLIQSGISLIFAGATLRGLVHFFGRVDRFALRSPPNRLTFFAMGTGVVALSWFSQMQSLFIDFDRHEFPSCADTLAIPISGITGMYLIVFALCLGVGALLSLGLNPLPTPLFAWRKDQPVKSVLVTIPFGCIALAIVFLGITSAWTSAFIGTPAAIVAVFLTEATRSALLNEPDVQS